jgi:hypothetical protein
MLVNVDIYFNAGFKCFIYLGLPHQLRIEIKYFLFSSFQLT